MPRRSLEERPSRVVRQSQQFTRAAHQLGRRIRELREKRSWTLEAAAERMQLDLKHLQKIEAGSLNVTLVTLVRIAKGLDESIQSLFASTGAGKK